jgi:cyclin B
VEYFQLLGITCLFIASKYEEIYPPELHDFLYVCGEKYRTKDVLSYELNILKKLNFDILCVSPFVFLDRYNLLYEVNDKETYYVAQMLIELCYFSLELMKYGPDLLAHSMLYLAMKLKNIKLGYSNNFQLYSNFSVTDVKNVIKTFWRFCEEFKEDNFPSILKKYNKKKYLFVSEKIKVFFKKRNSILK